MEKLLITYNLSIERQCYLVGIKFMPRIGDGLTCQADPASPYPVAHLTAAAQAQMRQYFVKTFGHSLLQYRVGASDTYNAVYG